VGGALVSVHLPFNLETPSQRRRCRVTNTISFYNHSTIILQSFYNYSTITCSNDLYGVISEIDTTVIRGEASYAKEKIKGNSTPLARSIMKALFTSACIVLTMERRHMTIRTMSAPLDSVSVTSVLKITEGLLDEKRPFSTTWDVRNGGHAFPKQNAAQSKSHS